MLTYLMDQYQYRIDPNRLHWGAIGLNNLAIASLLSRGCMAVSTNPINELCKEDRTLNTAYHLLNTRNYLADQDTLEITFSRYQKGGYDNDLLFGFIEYLIKEHHLQFTQEMIDKFREIGDQQMLKFVEEYTRNSNQGLARR
jgi:hypothetical protein